MEDFLERGAKKLVGAKSGLKTAMIGDMDIGTAKVVGHWSVGAKQPILADSKDKGKAGKDKDKDKNGKGKDKGGLWIQDKDKDKLKKGKKNPKWGKNDGKALTRSARAGLSFPVGRIHRLIKGYISHNMRVSGSAGVYVAAVMEYLTAEVMELAGNTTKELNTKRITPRHLQLAIRGDDELDTVIKATIAGGGVVPNIDKSFLTKSSKSSSKTQKYDMMAPAAKSARG